MDAGAAQIRAFVDRADRQPPGTLGDQHAGDFGRPVSIGVSLDDSTDLHVRSYNGLHVPEVSRDLGARHQYVRTKGSGHSLYSSGLRDKIRATIHPSRLVLPGALDNDGRGRGCRADPYGGQGFPEG